MRPSVMGVARSLTQSGLLQRFVTTVAVGNDSDPVVFSYLPDRLRTKLQSQFKRREVPAFLNVPVETYPTHELINLASRRVGLSDMSTHYFWEWAERAFDRKVATEWAGRAPCLYGCEHASVETFKRQKEAGGLNVLWQVIAHHHAVFTLLHEEYEAFPEAMTPYIHRMFRDAIRINERKEEQYCAADLIVTNSAFSRQTFIDAGFPAEKVEAIPTGCPPVSSNFPEPSERSNGKMIFLSAGTQSVRKGTSYLLDAWRRLSPGMNAELRLVGKMELPERLLKNLPANVVIQPSVTRRELDQILLRASVLVLPTLAEGLAYIILEAMAAGLAIITTDNSGCGDLVEDGINGWKLAIRDAAALADRVTWCLDEPRQVQEMQYRSWRKAAAWQEEDFALAHAALIRSFLVERGILPNAEEFGRVVPRCVAL